MPSFLPLEHSPQRKWAMHWVLHPQLPPPDSHFLFAVYKRRYQNFSTLKVHLRTTLTSNTNIHTHTHSSFTFFLLLSNALSLIFDGHACLWGGTASAVKSVKSVHYDTSPICALMHTPWLGFNRYEWYAEGAVALSIAGRTVHVANWPTRRSHWLLRALSGGWRNRCKL